MSGAGLGGNINNRPEPRDSDVGFGSLTDDQDQSNLDTNEVSSADKDLNTGENRDEEPPNLDLERIPPVDDANTTEDSPGDSKDSAGIIGAVASSIFGALTITANRLGVDRHAEAGLAEKAHGEAYAKKIGGEIVDDHGSAFTPDGGVDVTVDTPMGKKSLQSKHYKEPIGNATLEQYSDTNDAFGATNGLKESATPGEFGLDVVTKQDWPLNKRLEAHLRRTLRGYSKGFSVLQNSARSLKNRLGAVATTITDRGLSVGSRFANTRLAAWFKSQSLATQVGLTGGILLCALVGWHWYSDEDDQLVSEYTAELISKTAKQFLYGLVAAVSAALVVAIFAFVLLPLISNLWVAVVSAGRGAAKGNWKEAIGMGLVILGLLFLIKLCMELIGSMKYGEKINSHVVSKVTPEVVR